MTAEQKLINSQIRYALQTGALPIEIEDAPERDAKIRTLVWSQGVVLNKKFTVQMKGRGRWIIDIA